MRTAGPILQSGIVDTTLIGLFAIQHSVMARQGFKRWWTRILPPSVEQLSDPKFRTPLLYRHVRHPNYLGVLLAVWATPAMTVGHLLFSVVITGYILIGIQLEERDLIQQFGDQYRRYRQAAAYAAVNGNITKTTAQQLYHAKLAAKDAHALTLSDVCAAADVGLRSIHARN